MSERGLAVVEDLISPRAGLMSHSARLDTATGHPDWHVAGAHLGDLTAVRPEVGAAVPQPEPGSMNGAGTDRHLRRAAQLAAAESLERYTSCAWHDLPMRYASQRELESEGEACADLLRFAVVSERESARPACPLVPPDPDAVIRWVRGVDLVSRRPALVPAVCVFLYITPTSCAERFWLPISTGCAVHTDIAAALLGGLLEVVEREAIATTWLQRPSLPRLDPGSLEGDAAAFVERDTGAGMRVTLLDATTDLGAPTVYCLVRKPHGRRTQLVTCATAPDGRTAALKALREATSTWVAIEEAADVPDDPALFHDVMHGAVHMAAAERAHAFDFLEAGPTVRSVDDLPALPAAPDEALAVLLDRLEARGLQAFAVDLTTDEAARVGMRSVRVLVPGLVPLSFVPAAQFRGTPRLATVAAGYGAPPRNEEEMNPWPQPFA